MRGWNAWQLTFWLKLPEFRRLSVEPISESGRDMLLPLVGEPVGVLFIRSGDTFRELGYQQYQQYQQGKPWHCAGLQMIQRHSRRCGTLDSTSAGLGKWLHVGCGRRRRRGMR